MSEAALASVVKRLEAATLRLEEIARTKAPAGGPTPSQGADASAGASDGAAARAVSGYDELISGPLQEYMKLSASIGGLVQEQSQYFQEAIQAQRRLVEVAASSKKPNVGTIQESFKPIQTAVEKVTSLREKNRPSPLFNHLSTVSEGIPALAWPLVEPAPVPYVGEMKDSAQFYANRVIKEFKDKDASHVEWTKAYVGFYVELQAYVKKFHTTGLAWNPRGGDAKSFTGGSKAPAAAPAPTPAAAPASAPAKPAAAAGLFSELNRDGLTSALKKVDKSEMTHKNPELRASSVVKGADAPAPAPAKTFGGGAAPKAPPKFALEGNKWVVENQVNNQNIVIDQTELKHVVYIYNCQGSTIQIKGKVNAVTLGKHSPTNHKSLYFPQLTFSTRKQPDGSKKVGLLVENVVSTVDIVNCKSAQIQITGKAPTVVVDKTDGLQIYLSKAAADVEILSAKSSEMNVLLEGKDGDYDEKPLAEQFKTTIVNGALVTVAVEHKG
ncbi:F-actin-capping protein subunit alpha [Rhizophlyctis rosea]|uniref:Adenylyl cyclase-associated protein n=1 Tax=Rhizophlyctis rosea TaxID=64517 RepID=A0AAD5S681_9FUNG|nr:F-actin-capping protein subunit alpha [Rhizophlyctis rosea]